RGAELDRRTGDARRELLRVQRLVGGDHGGVDLGHDGGDLLGGLGRGGLGQLLAGGRCGRRLDLLAARGEQAGGEQAARPQEEAATADGASAHREFLPRTGVLVVAGHRRSSSTTASIGSARSSAARVSAAGGSAANRRSMSASSLCAVGDAAPSVRGSAPASAPAAPAATGAAASSSAVSGASSIGASASSSRRRPPSETTRSTRPITAIVAPPA